MTDEPTKKTRPTFISIAHALGERKPRPWGQLRSIVEFIGEEAALALLKEVQQVEANGGMMLPDGSRRRTPGGVYFYLAYKKLTPDQQRIVYAFPKNKKGKENEDGTEQPSVPPANWADRKDWIAIAKKRRNEATTVKITLIGSLGKTVEKKGFTLAMMQHTPKVDKLPKGIPQPTPTETSYIVYIGQKQWRKVRDALRNPEDMAIIEGVPMWDNEFESMTVFATSITTKLMQQTKREEQRAKAQGQPQAQAQAE
jgi:hypothetical protein